MSECNANVNVSSLDNTSTKTSTWPLLCVEKFMYDPSGDCFIRDCKHIKTSHLFQIYKKQHGKEKEIRRS